MELNHTNNEEVLSDDEVKIHQDLGNRVLSLAQVLIELSPSREKTPSARKFDRYSSKKKYTHRFKTIISKNNPGEQVGLSSSYEFQRKNDLIVVGVQSARLWTVHADGVLLSNHRNLGAFGEEVDFGNGIVKVGISKESRRTSEYGEESGNIMPAMDSNSDAFHKLMDTVEFIEKLYKI